MRYCSTVGVNTSATSCPTADGRSAGSGIEWGQGDAASLVAASTFCNVAAALDSHVSEARRKKWCLPEQIVAGPLRAADFNLTLQCTRLPVMISPV